jgi:hypothetical protein
MNKVVYLLRDPVSLEIRYVGKGTPKRPYLIKGNQRSGHCKNWISSLKAKDLEPTVDVIFTELSDEAASVIEKAYIKALRPKGRLTNLTEGGEGAPGYKVTEETKAHLSAIKKGRPISDATREGAAEFRKANPEWATIPKGSKLSESHKQALRESKSGKDYSKVNYSNAPKVPCVCLDTWTGDIKEYPTLRSCAAAIGVENSVVGNHVRRKSKLLANRFNITKKV